MPFDAKQRQPLLSISYLARFSRFFFAADIALWGQGGRLTNAHVLWENLFPVVPKEALSQFEDEFLLSFNLVYYTSVFGFEMKKIRKDEPFVTKTCCLSLSLSLYLLWFT